MKIEVNLSDILTAILRDPGGYKNRLELEVYKNKATYAAPECEKEIRYVFEQCYATENLAKMGCAILEVAHNLWLMCGNGSGAMERLMEIIDDDQLFWSEVRQYRHGIALMYADMAREGKTVNPPFAP